MSGARAVCFDLDGTLLRDDHVDGVVRAVAAQIAESHDLDADALADANERAWWECWPEMGEAWLRGELAPESVPTEVWRRALAEVGVTDPAVAAQAHALHTQTEQTAFRLYEESAEVLSGLRERGIRIALITNGPSGLQRAKLRAVGIEEAFDVVIVSGEHGVHKPDGQIFALALEGLGVAASDALHIGDNLVADIAGAREAGLTAVWIDRSASSVPDGDRPETVVASLRELYGMVEVG